MSDQKKYTLCGGIFLVLLLRARKPRTAARKNSVGEKDGLSDSELFEGLIRTAFPNHMPPAGNSFKTYTSSYKKCALSSNEYLPFERTELIQSFDSSFKENYNEFLKRMCQFTSVFIDEDNLGSWLVRAILEVINYDETITDELIFAGAGGQAYNKTHLLSERNIELQPFLLGIWHFILMHRPDNTIGAATFEKWHSLPANPKSKREFTSNIGLEWNKNLQINLVSLEDLEDEESGQEKSIYDIPDGMAPILLPDGIAPELTGDAPWLLVPKDIMSASDFDEYLENAYHKYSTMKTLLYSDAPRDFKSFYVCNNITQKIPVKKYTYRTKTISDATAETLRDCSNFVLISGTGGLGKSMMMRHLLLDAIERYGESEQIPIFVPLKDYSESYDNLFEYTYEKFEMLGGSSDPCDFVELLENERCLLLFDGLDEIKSTVRKKFEHDLDEFVDKYTENMYVISSRPIGSFVSLHRFTVLDLCPFTKEQAVSLIDNLDFRPDEPVIKEKFRTELQNTLFVTHREFTQNPLLLTIMLMTYEQFAEIPSKMHIFYREAYVALSQKHDASKGAYKRVLKTGLTADRFADYFAEFCARSYRDEKFEFTDLEFDKYFNSLNERSKCPHRITASDFKDDLVENMCLMFYEGGKYHFTHRSFQEYFCALFFSKQKDKTLKYTGDFFEDKGHRSYTDRTFNMLYDMIPEKIEEYIFEPFLTSLFAVCDAEDGYYTFLRKMYPVLFYEDGDTNGCEENEPESFLYGFIIHSQNIDAFITKDDLPVDERFVTNEWVYLDEDYHDEDLDTDALIDIDEIPWDYKDQFGEPDVVGRNYELKISEVLDDPDTYEDVIVLLENNDFPIKAEFLAAREYLTELLDRHDSVGDDFFDVFR